MSLTAILIILICGQSQRLVMLRKAIRKEAHWAAIESSLEHRAQVLISPPPLSNDIDIPFVRMETLHFLRPCKPAFKHSPA